MLPLTQSYDPRSQSDIAWALPQIAARGAMTTIVGPVGIGSLYAVALTVHAAVRGLRVGSVDRQRHRIERSDADRADDRSHEIGRASCRERV